jgi:hypothetical protein
MRSGRSGSPAISIASYSKAYAGDPFVQCPVVLGRIALWQPGTTGDRSARARRSMRGKSRPKMCMSERRGRCCGCCSPASNKRHLPNLRFIRSVSNSMCWKSVSMEVPCIVNPLVDRFDCVVLAYILAGMDRVSHDEDCPLAHHSPSRAKGCYDDDALENATSWSQRLWLLRRRISGPSSAVVA